ncbi:DUF2071 domain-containing protein [Nocardia transvalensis]|uniref:DUF2071 domain-containing protein n=1 Tax=Nocardia transvalensis TaxID=37333 RepID=UPI00189495C2|nr:DUF2071 domain-containing protein [Nocardia transvalensis]MBF6331753.1 DUF2071 domain-containing protein [Nocardia transvalensis]
MIQPRISSVIERRLLVNYRVEPAVVEPLIPAPLRPRQVNGWAVAGICLIRLAQVRPTGLPSAVGVHSENAAHRIAVEWAGPDGIETGVYIPRRDSGSALNVWLGGRLFPGVHYLADFDVREDSDDLQVSYTSRDLDVHVSVEGQVADRFEGSALFPDLATASDFFRCGATGFSDGRDPACLDGLELSTDRWRIEPVRTRAARSSYFDDPNRFPPGSAALDCTLLMRNITATWAPVTPMRVGEQSAPAGGRG